MHRTQRLVVVLENFGILRHLVESLANLDEHLVKSIQDVNYNQPNLYLYQSILVCGIFFCKDLFLQN